MNPKIQQSEFKSKFEKHVEERVNQDALKEDGVVYEKYKKTVQERHYMALRMKKTLVRHFSDAIKDQIFTDIELKAILKNINSSPKGKKLLKEFGLTSSRKLYIFLNLDKFPKQKEYMNLLEDVENNPLLLRNLNKITGKMKNLAILDLFQTPLVQESHFEAFFAGCTTIQNQRTGLKNKVADLRPDLFFKYCKGVDSDQWVKKTLIRLASKDPNSFAKNFQRLSNNETAKTFIQLIPKINKKNLYRIFKTINKFNKLSAENKKEIRDKIVDHLFKSIGLKEMFEKDYDLFIKTFNTSEYKGKVAALKKKKEFAQDFINTVLKKSMAITKIRIKQYNEHKDYLKYLKAWYIKHKEAYTRSRRPNKKPFKVLLTTLDKKIKAAKNMLKVYQERKKVFFSDPGLQRICDINPEWIKGKFKSKKEKYEMMIYISRKLYFQNKKITKENVQSVQKTINEQFEKYGNIPLFKGRKNFVLFLGSDRINTKGISEAIKRQDGQLDDKNIHQFSKNPTYEEVMKKRKALKDFIINTEGKITLFILLHGRAHGVFLAKKIKGSQTPAQKKKVGFLTYKELASWFILRGKNPKIKDKGPICFGGNQCISNEGFKNFLAAVKKGNGPSMITFGAAEQGEIARSGQKKLKYNTYFQGKVLNFEKADKNNPTTIKMIRKRQFLERYSNPSVFIQTKEGTTQLVDKGKSPSKKNRVQGPKQANV